MLASSPRGSTAATLYLNVDATNFRRFPADESHFTRLMIHKPALKS